MREPDFKYLLEIIIESSLESKSNIAKRLCLEGDRLIGDDWQHFIETLGEKIPEKLLNRLNLGHEMVVFRFVNKNEERYQPTENRQIHSIYFPSDCQLFIYIPTEHGSYWYQFDMQRASKRNQHELLDSKKKSLKIKEINQAVEGFKDTGVIIHCDGRNTAHNSKEDNRIDMLELCDIEKKSSTDVKSLVAEDEKIKERNQLNLLPGGERRKLLNMGKSYANSMTLAAGSATPNITGEESNEYYICLLGTNNFNYSFLCCQLKILDLTNNINHSHVDQFNLLEETNNVINHSSHCQCYIWLLGTNNFIYFIVCCQRLASFLKTLVILEETNNVINHSSHCQNSNLQLLMDDDINEKRISRDYIVMKDRNKEQEKIQQSFSIVNSSSDFVSGQNSAGINVYISVIRNETYRMMESIEITMSKAMQLFGPERTQIFWDLLADMLPIFGSAGAIPGFVPNMAKSAIRDQVISVFEYPRVVMNQIMTLLLSCPDGERLRKMPESVFRALLEIIIESLPESEIITAKGLCLEGKRSIVDDLQQFIEKLGEKIPDKLLNRLNPGHEVVNYRFDDKNERAQPAEKKKKRLIHSIYFPPDCRLFIYIPTEKGSYWHELEMRIANRF